MNKPVLAGTITINFPEKPMKWLSQVALLTAFIAFPMTAKANQGGVGFDGNITTPSCTVAATGAASGSGAGISLDFGELRMGDLQAADVWSAAAGKAFNLVVTCPGNMAGYRIARATFTAAGGSGTDPTGSRLLGLSSASVARGVAVGLWASTTGGPLDLSSNPSLTGPFIVTGANGVATIGVNAIYSRTTPTVVAGTASATLPFALTYE